MLLSQKLEMRRYTHKRTRKQKFAYTRLDDNPVQDLPRVVDDMPTRAPDKEAGRPDVTAARALAGGLAARCGRQYCGDGATRRAEHGKGVVGFGLVPLEGKFADIGVVGTVDVVHDLGEVAAAAAGALAQFLALRGSDGGIEGCPIGVEKGVEPAQFGFVKRLRVGGGRHVRRTEFGRAVAGDALHDGDVAGAGGRGEWNAGRAQQLGVARCGGKQGVDGVSFAASAARPAMPVKGVGKGAFGSGFEIDLNHGGIIPQVAPNSIPNYRLKWVKFVR